LAELSFPLRELQLQVVRDQKQKSLAVRGIKSDDNSSVPIASIFEKPKNLDIRLHEGLRILKDWFNFIKVAEVSQSKQSTIKKI